MTRETILAMRGRELDAAVAEQVMGFERMALPGWPLDRYILMPFGYSVCGKMPVEQGSILSHTLGRSLVPFYSTSANECQLMEAEIEQRTWEMGYIMELAGLLWPGSECSKLVNPFGLSRMDTFEMMRSPLEMRCHAALICAMLAKGEQHNADMDAEGQKEGAQ